MGFRCFLNTGSVLAEVTLVGKLFQRRGAAMPKMRSPAVDRRDRVLVQIRCSTYTTGLMALDHNSKTNTHCEICCFMNMTSDAPLSGTSLRHHMGRDRWMA